MHCYRRTGAWAARKAGRSLLLYFRVCHGQNIVERMISGLKARSTMLATQQNEHCKKAGTCLGEGPSEVDAVQDLKMQR